MNDGVICPYCQHEASDCTNGGDPGPWWNGEDDSFDLECDACGKDYVLETCWSPSFETSKKDEA